MRRPNPTVFPSPSDRLKVLPLDITKPETIEKALFDSVALFGSIDVLINNAGIGMASAVEATPDNTIREVFDTNTFGVFSVCRAIIPQMRNQGHGTIINVTSSVTIGVMPLVAVYAASKFAVEGYTDSLSYELEQFNIKARLVEPGYAPTTRFTANGGERMQGLIPADYGAFAQAYFEKMANYPTAYCTETEVAEGTRLRYLAGADSKMLAELRWSTSEDHYRARMRDMFAPDIGKATDAA
jgi:NAD(P)-dependent dehydrogenase (short-subunit alcohol dehydrogenase family)